MSSHNYLLHLHTLSRASRIKRLSASTTFFDPQTIRRYYNRESRDKESHDMNGDPVIIELPAVEEIYRAPSLAEEFKKVEEEKERAKRILELKAKQGFVSNSTVEKAEEVFEEPLLEEVVDHVETAKEKYKEPVGN